MPQPTAGDLYFNRPLSNLAVAYQQQRNFIADRVFPIVGSQVQSGIYYTYDRRFWQRTEAQKRAPGTPSAGAGYRVGTAPPFFCDVWALHYDVADQIRANTERPFDADRDATNFVTEQMLLRREKEFAKFFVPGIWGVDTDLTSARWDATGADPIDVITTASLRFRRVAGRRANTIVMSPGVETALMNNNLILDRIKYTQRGIVTTDLLATLFGVDTIHVLDATEYTGEEPDPNGAILDQTVPNSTEAAKFKFINQDPNTGTAGEGFFWMGYVTDSPSFQNPSAGYTIAWQGYLGASAYGGRIKRFRLEELASDRVEMEMAYDQKVVAADMGMLWTNVHDPL